MSGWQILGGVGAAHNGPLRIMLPACLLYYALEVGRNLIHCLAWQGRGFRGPAPSPKQVLLFGEGSVECTLTTPLKKCAVGRGTCCMHAPSRPLKLTLAWGTAGEAGG